MGKLAHCATYRTRPVEYVCPICENFPQCEACEQEHVNDTQNTHENCKEVAIMHRHIQCVGGRVAKVLGLRKGMKEFEAGVLREIDRLQESCMQTEERCGIRMLDREGKYTELYTYIC